MPNYCQSKLLVIGDKDIIKQMEEERFSRREHLWMLDFDKVLPMPKSLHIEAGCMTSFTQKLLYPTQGQEPLQLNEVIATLSFRKDVLPDDAAQPQSLKDVIGLLKQTPQGRHILLEGHLRQRNLKQYGCTDWYEWSIDNWGTKWNCTDFSKEQHDSEKSALYFMETAWSPPLPVIDELACLYPKLRFEMSFLELGADFAGESYWQNGFQEFFNLDCDAQQMAIDVFGYDKSDFNGDCNDSNQNS